MAVPANPDFSFRLAACADAPRVAALINAAYRGIGDEPGWTHEASLFDGPRTNAAALAGLIAGGDSLILLCMQGPEIAGSVHLEKDRDGAYLGLLAVNPSAQGSGVG